ncbi:unnamed protein product [Ilex paraguariensis]|uniref:Uncharacterized protein n=1 Tax=Ilex paraguariensis TaxID=185542 RepID=A0ABC8TAE6_9AQUA
MAWRSPYQLHTGSQDGVVETLKWRDFRMAWLTPWHRDGMANSLTPGWGDRLLGSKMAWSTPCELSWVSSGSCPLRALAGIIVRVDHVHLVGLKFFDESDRGRSRLQATDVQMPRRNARDRVLGDGH